MIGKYFSRELLSDRDSLMIDAARCATVRTENTLMHAMLVLTSVGYSSIPVLDEASHLAGTVTMPGIIKGVLEGDNYNWDLLNRRKVREVMDADPPTAPSNASLEEILRLLIQSNYICIADPQGLFKGIIARKQVLQRLNRLAHEFEIEYNVTPAHPFDRAVNGFPSASYTDVRAI